jgi:histidyl-tRNA synthetase
VVYELRGRSVRKQFRAAESAGAAATLVLGPEEATEGVVVLRDMASGEERRVAPEELG